MGINIDITNAAPDVILYSEFENLNDLRAYQQHSEHLKGVEFFYKVCSEKRAVDYKI